MVTKRKFSREFKFDILRQIEQTPLAVVCKEHEIHPTLVNRWKREQQQYPKDAFKGRGNQYKLEAEIAKLQRLVGQLYAEKELLKKAIGLARERQAEERMLRSTK